MRAALASMTIALAYVFLFLTLGGCSQSRLLLNQIDPLMETYQIKTILFLWDFGSSSQSLCARLKNHTTGITFYRVTDSLLLEPLGVRGSVEKRNRLQKFEEYQLINSSASVLDRDAAIKSLDRKYSESLLDTGSIVSILKQYHVDAFLLGEFKCTDSPKAICTLNYFLVSVQDGKTLWRVQAEGEESIVLVTTEKTAQGRADTYAYEGWSGACYNAMDAIVEAFPLGAK